MIGPFQLSCTTPLVWFGTGRSAQVRERAQALGCKRALVACTSSGAKRYASVREALGDNLVATFDKAQPHCPIEVANAALELFKSEGCDCVVTVGGGSSIGIGKYIAVETGSPHICLPTTLSGSEMTPLYGVLTEGVKKSRREPKALANTVIVDPALAKTLPLKETASTGMNALAHLFEAVYMPDSSPVTNALSLQGIEALYSALNGLAHEPESQDLRERAAFGSMLGGFLVASVGIGLHHRVCHVLGGRFGAPHGETNGVILPKVLAFNAPAIASIWAQWQQALGGDPSLQLEQLAARLGAPTSLKELGVPRNQLAEVAKEVLGHGALPNPRPVTQENLVELLEAAWEPTTVAGAPHV